MKTLYTTLIAAGLLLASGCACAALVNTATFDFGEIAKNNEQGASSFTFTEGGISVTASGYYMENTQGKNYADVFAYLDHDSNGNAGLGVCQALTGNQCTDRADDSVQRYEVLKLVFDQEVAIESLFFKNGGHRDAFANGSSFKFQVDNGNWAPTTLGTDVLVRVTGTTFEIANFNADHGDDEAFYLNAMTVSTVPVPAAVWLFGSGLLGLVAVGRRKAVA